MFQGQIEKIAFQSPGKSGTTVSTHVTFYWLVHIEKIIPLTIKQNTGRPTLISLCVRNQ